MTGPTFITRERDAITALMHAFETLASLAAPYTALDLGNTLTPEDFAAGNTDVTLAQLVAAVGSVAALQAVLAAGHATNLYRLSR